MSIEHDLDAANPPAKIPQHMSALERANMIRLRRASVRRSVRSGTKAESITAVADIVLADEECMRSIAVHDLLDYPKGFGPVRAERMIRTTFGSLHPDKRLCQLTERQRSMLHEALIAEAQRVEPAAFRSERGEILVAA